jgi:hypothetical protein
MRRIRHSGFEGKDLAIEPTRGKLVGEWVPIEGQQKVQLDFDCPAELCRCCGQQLLRSGSRWSVWFCTPCKKRVFSLNHRARTCVIPIGRHSLMNGVFGEARPRTSRVEIAGVAVSLRKLFESIDDLAEWAQEIVRRNCASVGLGDRARVPLGDYLGAVKRAKLSRAEAFRQMLVWSSA